MLATADMVTYQLLKQFGMNDFITDQITNYRVWPLYVRYVWMYCCMGRVK